MGRLIDTQSTYNTRLGRLLKSLKMFGWRYPIDPIFGADPRYFIFLFSCENDKKMKQCFHVLVVSSTCGLF